jgi:hypothetical protein
VNAGRRRLAGESAAVLVGYTALAVVLCWPVPAHLGSSVLGLATGDAAAGVWWYDAIQATGYHLFGTTTFADVAAPFGYEQGNALNIQWLWPNYPTYLLAGAVGAVAAYNVAVIAGFALSGAAMYLLARRIGCGRPVAAWAGFVFVLLPWHTERAVAGHVTLVHLECFPLLLVAIHAFWRRPRRLAVAGVALAALLCWLTSGIFGVMAVLVVGACAAATLLLVRPWPTAGLRAALLVGAALGATAAVYALSLPGGAADVGVARDAADLSTYGLRPSELLVPPPRSALFENALDAYHVHHMHGSSAQEVSNYLGWLTIVLAVAGAAVAIRRRRARADLGLLATGMLAAVAGSLALAAPSPVGVGGHLVRQTPSWVLFQALPAFRVPARWSVVIGLAVVVLAALGLQALWEAAAVRARRPVIVAVALFAAAFVLSYAELSIGPGRFRFDASPLPPAYALLRGVPPGTIAEYPLVPNGNWENGQYLFWQRLHGRPLVNGAAVHTHADDVRKTIVDPTAPGAAARLAALGVVAITTRPDVVSDEVDSSLLPARRPGAGFELLGTADDVDVWRVIAKPADALATLPSTAFGDLEVVRGTIVQPLRRADGEILVDASTGGRAALRLTVFSDGPGGTTVRIGGHTFNAAPDGTSVCVPVSLTGGRNVVGLRALRRDRQGRLTFTAPVVTGECGRVGTRAETG